MGAFTRKFRQLQSVSGRTPSGTCLGYSRAVSSFFRPGAFVLPRSRGFEGLRSLGAVDDGGLPVGNYYQAPTVDALIAGLKVQWPNIIITSGPTNVGSVLDQALAVRIGRQAASPQDGNAGNFWWFIQYKIPGITDVGQPQPGTQAYVLAAEQAAAAKAVPIGAPSGVKTPAPTMLSSSPSSTAPARPVATVPVASSNQLATPFGTPAVAAPASVTSWLGGSTTLFGVTLSNSTLAIGAAIAAAVLYFSSGKKGKR